MRIVRLWLGWVVVASIALTGCSKREELKLAECKDRVITVRDFEEAYARVGPEFLPKKTGMEGKKEFLETMLNRDVMAVKADELGYDKDPSVAQGMEAFRRMATQIAYLRKQVGEIKVPDDDVRRAYDLQGTTLTIKQILCDREDQAQEAYQALEDGQDFEAVLTQYSKSEDAKDGGTAITAPYGMMVEEVSDPLFRLPVGGYTEPIFTAQGWAILKVLKIDKKKRQLAKYEDIKEKLREHIRGERETAAVNAFTEKLREQYGVTWNYDNMEIVFAALPADRPFEEAPPRDQEVFPLLFFEAGDLDKPLVSYPGRTITIKDFSDLYDQASFFNRPRRQMRIGGIRGFLVTTIMNDISNDAVTKSGIEDDPEVKKVLRLKQDEIMSGLLYEDLINKRTVITHDKIEEYYKGNAERFRQPERRKFGVVVAGDITGAQQAQEELRTGKPVATVAAAYSVDGETLETKGLTELLVRGQNRNYDQGFMLDKVGAVSEPFQTEGGWMVLKVMEISPERTFTLDEARSQIDAALRGTENDARLKVLLAEWKEEFKVVIHEDNLKKVKITERSATAQPVEKVKKATS